MPQDARGWRRSMVRALALGGLALWGACSSGRPAWAQVPDETTVTGTASQPDATGAYTISLDLEHLMPVQVKKGTAWEHRFVYWLPNSVTIRRVRTFFGVGRSDVFEGHVLITVGDFVLYARGPHKETALASYDAWHSEQVAYTNGNGSVGVQVDALCSPTKAAAVSCHVGVILEVAPVAQP